MIGLHADGCARPAPSVAPESVATAGQDVGGIGRGVSRRERPMMLG